MSVFAGAKPHPVRFALDALAKVKLLHWASRRYGDHVALDKLYDSLSEHTDRLVEAHAGIVGPIPANSSYTVTCTLGPSLTDALRALKADAVALHEALAQEELKNVMQDIIADVDKTLYLVNMQM